VFDLPAVPPPTEPLDTQNLGRRSRQVARLHPEYTEDFILQHLQSMVLARVPKDQIAQRFGVSVRTIYKWEQRLYAKIRLLDRFRSKNP
jgi:DNA-directed RNA polymerase specialized sigma24 family protein